MTAQQRRPTSERIDGVTAALPGSAIAFRLAAALSKKMGTGLYLAPTAEDADAVAASLRLFALNRELLVFPPWDCLPYERVSPSRASMGRRMAVLKRLLDSTKNRLVITSVEAVIQRVPPRSVVREASFRLKVGSQLDRAGLEHYARQFGYLFDDRVDEPGEIAFRGAVVDVYPPNLDLPRRLVLDERDNLTEILIYDPETQRTSEPVDDIELGAASELVWRSEDQPPEPQLGAEHELARYYDKLETLADYLGDEALVLGPGVEERLDTLAEQIDEAYGASRDLGNGEAVPAPAALYLDKVEFADALNSHARLELDLTGIKGAVPLRDAADPLVALTELLTEYDKVDGKTVLAGTRHELQRFRRVLSRSDAPDPEQVADWLAALKSKAAIVAVEMELEGGFVDGKAHLAVVAGPDIFGPRLIGRASNVSAFAIGHSAFDPGDVVVHEDYGVGIFKELERIEVDGAERDAARLEYHGGASVLVPMEDFGKLWRYGADPAGVKIDRLNSDAWANRRAEVSVAIDEAAIALANRATERLSQKLDPIIPPAAAFGRVTSRFRYRETPDQAKAIGAVLDDLRAGRPMNRLIVGDVGFGKTEVALRAAAAVALAGKQVAVVAPTTVLVRQHLETFRRRFAGTGLEVAQLSRLVAPSEAKAVKEGLEAGDVRIVIATQAIAAADVSFADLGLVIIDEEQRFGAKFKRQLQELTGDVHVLTMSATPIPRTLQTALVGIQDVSLIATPPVRRRPVRTYVAAFDEATARLALVRERRRGGQSFIVVPRIADIETVSDTVRRLVPELDIVTAHGELAAADVDTAIVRFANGHGDVLLSTDIIESGLDVPGANTMLVWHGERFGLAQLHQLRGRVGRGRVQGMFYLFTDPDEELAEAAQSRLSTLERLDRLGAGFEISARDLDLRGGGELLGDEQAGHMKLIGTGLYQQLFERALKLARGLTVEDRRVELNLGSMGYIPAEYIPDVGPRIDLYARLQRLADASEVRAFGNEVEDRFGILPPPVHRLLEATRLGLKARKAGIAKVDSGPLALGLSFVATPSAKLRSKAAKMGASWKDGRLILPHNIEEADDRLAAAMSFVDRVLRWQEEEHARKRGKVAQGQSS